ITVVPTLIGWGAIPDDHPLMAGVGGMQTHTRYGNANFLESDIGLGIGNRWANRHTGDLKVYRADGNFIHLDIEQTQIGRVLAAGYGMVSDAKAALQALVDAARKRKAAGSVPEYSTWSTSCTARKGQLQRKTHYDEKPIKPQRVYQEMN